MDRPVTSDGSRSGVNWMRRNVQPRLRAIALARTVLPVPGTSSMRRWPRHRSATSERRTSWCLPTMTRSTLARTLSPTCWMLLIGLPSSCGLDRRLSAGPGHDARTQSLGDAARAGYGGGVAPLDPVCDPSSDQVLG